MMKKNIIFLLVICNLLCSCMAQNKIQDTSVPNNESKEISKENDINNEVEEVKKFLMNATEAKIKTIDNIYDKFNNSDDKPIVGKKDEKLPIIKVDGGFESVIYDMSCYYNKTIIEEQLEKYGIFNCKGNIGVLNGADGEMAFEIKDKSRVEIINENVQEVIAEVQLYEESEEDYWIYRFCLEAIDGTYIINDIIELGYIKDYKSITSSSYLEKYPIELAFDFDMKTSWAEGNKKEGIGEWIDIKFDEIRGIHGIDILNGYSGKKELYYANNRVKKIRIEFSDGYSVDKELKNDYPVMLQRVDFERRESDFIKITILEVYNGDKYDDTCIAELRIF